MRQTFGCFLFSHLQLKGGMCWKAPFWSDRYKVIIKWAKVSFEEKKRCNRASVGVFNSGCVWKVAQFAQTKVFIQNILLEANKKKRCNCNQMHSSFPVWKYYPISNSFAAENNQPWSKIIRKKKNRILHYGILRQWDRWERQDKKE